MEEDTLSGWLNNMLYNLRSAQEFLGFRTGDDIVDFKAIEALAKAQNRELLSDCYQSPITGCGYSVILKGDDFIARMWNLEIVVEYKGKAYSKRKKEELQEESF